MNLILLTTCVLLATLCVRSSTENLLTNTPNKEVQLEMTGTGTVNPITNVLNENNNGNNNANVQNNVVNNNANPDICAFCLQDFSIKPNFAILLRKDIDDGKKLDHLKHAARYHKDCDHNVFEKVIYGELTECPECRELLSCHVFDQDRFKELFPDLRDDANRGLLLQKLRSVEPVGMEPLPQQRPLIQQALSKNHCCNRFIYTVMYIYVFYNTGTANNVLEYFSNSFQMLVPFLVRGYHNPSLGQALVAGMALGQILGADQYLMDAMAQEGESYAYGDGLARQGTEKVSWLPFLLIGMDWLRTRRLDREATALPQNLNWSSGSAPCFDACLNVFHIWVSHWFIQGFGTNVGLFFLFLTLFSWDREYIWVLGLTILNLPYLAYSPLISTLVTILSVVQVLGLFFLKKKTNIRVPFFEQITKCC